MLLFTALPATGHRPSVLIIVYAMIKTIALIIMLLSSISFFTGYDDSIIFPRKQVDFSFELEDGTKVLTQDNVSDAVLRSYVDTAGNQAYLVEIMFDAAGKEAFAQATADHTGERIVILVNGETVSTPVIMEPITNGKSVITGLSYKEAEELVEMLGK